MILPISKKLVDIFIGNPVGLMRRANLGTSEAE
jgi:hypothetical protein